MDIWFFNINFQNLPQRTELKKIQHFYSEKFLEILLRDFYKNKAEILVKSGKKFLKNNSLYFSISHSHNLLAFAFDKAKIGIDVELLKNRNHSKILKYFGINQQNISPEEFYKIWTAYEAEYKSGTNKNLKNFKYKNFICAISSENSGEPYVYESDVSDKYSDIAETLIQKALLVKPEYLCQSKIKLK